MLKGDRILNIPIKVSYRPNPETLSQLNRTFGPSYAKHILPPVINDVAKRVLSECNFSRLDLERDEITNRLQKELAAKCQEFYIIIDEVSIEPLE